MEKAGDSEGPVKTLISAQHLKPFYEDMSKDDTDYENNDDIPPHQLVIQAEWHYRMAV